MRYGEKEYSEFENKYPRIYLYFTSFIRYGYKCYGSLWIKILQKEYFKYINKNIFKLKDWAYVYNKKKNKTEGAQSFISKFFDAVSYPEEISAKEILLLFKARNYHFSGFFNLEEQIYKDILSRKTGFSYRVFALYFYGKLLHKKANFNESIKIFEEFIKLNKNIVMSNKIAYYFLGLCYEGKNNRKQAINNYHIAAKNNIRGIISEFGFKRASRKLYLLKDSDAEFCQKF